MDTDKYEKQKEHFPEWKESGLSKSKPQNLQFPPKKERKKDFKVKEVCLLSPYHIKLDVRLVEAKDNILVARENL